MLYSNSFLGSPVRQLWPKPCLNGFFVYAPLGYSLCVTLAWALPLQVLGLAVLSLYFQLLWHLISLLLQFPIIPKHFFKRGITFAALSFSALAVAFVVHYKKLDHLHCANYLVCQSYSAPVRNFSSALVGEGSMILNCILQLSQVKSIFMPLELKPKKNTPHWSLMLWNSSLSEPVSKCLSLLRFITTGVVSLMEKI